MFGERGAASCVIAAVQLIGNLKRPLGTHAADLFAVFETERDVMPAHFEDARGAFRPAESVVEKASIMRTEFARRSIVRRYLAAHFRRNDGALACRQEIELPRRDHELAVFGPHDRPPEILRFVRIDLPEVYLFGRRRKRLETDDVSVEINVVVQAVIPEHELVVRYSATRFVAHHAVLRVERRYLSGRHMRCVPRAHAKLRERDTAPNAHI